MFDLFIHDILENIWGYLLIFFAFYLMFSLKYWSDHPGASAASRRKYGASRSACFCIVVKLLFDFADRFSS